MGHRRWGADPRTRWAVTLVTVAVLVGVVAMGVLPAGAATAGRGGTTLAIGVATLSPLVALIAGILILLMPRLLNYIVAIYLIIAGLLGLGIFGR
jgi:DUF3096 family protein